MAFIQCDMVLRECQTSVAPATCAPPSVCRPMAFSIDVSTSVMPACHASTITTAPNWRSALLTRADVLDGHANMQASQGDASSHTSQLISGHTNLGITTCLDFAADEGDAFCVAFAPAFALGFAFALSVAFTVGFAFTLGFGFALGVCFTCGLSACFAATADSLDASPPDGQGVLSFDATSSRSASA